MPMAARSRLPGPRRMQNRFSKAIPFRQKSAGVTTRTFVHTFVIETRRCTTHDARSTVLLQESGHPGQAIKQLPRRIILHQFLETAYDIRLHFPDALLSMQTKFTRRVELPIEIVAHLINSFRVARVGIKDR